MPHISSPAELKEYLLEQCSSEEVAKREFFKFIHEMEPDLPYEEASELERQQDRFWDHPYN